MQPLDRLRPSAFRLAVAAAVGLTCAPVFGGPPGLGGTPVDGTPVAAGVPGQPGVIVQGPTPPPQFGFYGTRWRRWNAADAIPAKSGEAATPSGPPRSVVPGAGEEALADPRDPTGGRRGGPAADDEPRGGAAQPEWPPPQGALPDAQPDGRENPRPLPPADPRREPLPPPPAGGEEPRPPRPGAARAPQAAPPATRRFLATLPQDAAVAKSGTPAQQAEFTRRLVGELLSAHDPETRRAIVEVAAEFDTPAAAAICSGALEDPSPVVRMAACTVCARRGGPEVVPLLGRKCTADPDLGVRLRAITALGEAGDPAAAAALVAVLDDPDPAIRTRTIDSLKRISGRNLGDDAAAWRRWAANPRQPPARWSMTEALRKLF